MELESDQNLFVGLFISRLSLKISGARVYSCGEQG